MTLLEIKRALRSGKYSRAGAYPLYFITSDGAALSFEAVRQEWRHVCEAHICDGWRHSGWYIQAIDANWEDTDLICAHTGNPIECAYGP